LTNSSRPAGIIEPSGSGPDSGDSVRADPCSAGERRDCTGGIGRNAAAFSPDGSTLAVIVAEGSCPRWRAGISWRGDQVRWLDTAAPNDSAAGLSWSPHGRHFAAGLVSTRRAVVVFDAQRFPRARTIAEGVNPAWSPDGSEERRIGPGEPIQWSPSGNDVALLDSVGVLRVVSLSTGETRRVAEDVVAAAVAPEWHPLATLSRDGAQRRPTFRGVRRRGNRRPPGTTHRFRSAICTRRVASTAPTAPTGSSAPPLGT
jgi:dipeptidyl aminopeptidase/acylaminoacyl peptidase